MNEIPQKSTHTNRQVVFQSAETYNILQSTLARSLDANRRILCCSQKLLRLVRISLRQIELRLFKCIYSQVTVFVVRVSKIATRSCLFRRMHTENSVEVLSRLLVIKVAMASIVCLTNFIQ